MKKIGLILLVISICFSPLFPQEKNYKARAAAAGSVDASMLSMAIWGVGLSVGIAAIFLLIKESDSDNGHAHHD